MASQSVCAALPAATPPLRCAPVGVTFGCNLAMIELRTGLHSGSCHGWTQKAIAAMWRWYGSGGGFCRSVPLPGPDAARVHVNIGSRMIKGGSSADPIVAPTHEKCDECRQQTGAGSEEEGFANNLSGNVGQE